jgi:hypothetical protein
MRYSSDRDVKLKLGYVRLMYLMLRGLIMDGHNSLNLTSLSLLYRFVNILYIWTLFLLLITFWHEWSGLVTLCNKYSTLPVLTFIPSLWLYLMHPNTISQFLTFFTSGLNFYCWTRFDTNVHALLRLLTNCSIKSVLTSIPYIWLVLMQPNQISKFLTIHNLRWYLIFLGQVRLRQVRLC